MNIKIIAMYLPQFHRVKENDAWWGEGFTEWTSVRSAEPLFHGHEQPHVPLHENYYDLMDPMTMRWQASLMHRYGVDGMCFYHYYFKDGRRILERPAENLLQWQDIDMPFCFSWANESWIRSWSRLAGTAGNAWSPKFDRDRQAGEGDGILLAQEYGDEDAWRKHYAYLSPFFHDRRYILHDGMPLFLIYKPEKIPCIHEMLALWEELSRADGFDGVFTVGTHCSDPVPLGLKAANLPEPQETIARFFPEKFQNANGVRALIDYRDIWKKILGKSVPQGRFLGGFTGYDDTPRRGRGGTVIDGRSPEIFYQGMKALLAKAGRLGSPYIFLNAWNEWGEGMHLEPDERFGFGFLEALKRARDEAGASRGEDAELRWADGLAAARAETATLQRKCDRYRGYWETMDAWIRLLERHGSIASWLRMQGIHEVAIYGCGMLGRHLLHQLSDDGFCVSYAIDRDGMKGNGEMPMYSMEDDLPQTEAVIVAVSYDVENIRSALARKGVHRILPLSIVLQGALEQLE